MVQETNMFMPSSRPEETPGGNIVHDKLKNEDEMLDDELINKNSS